MDCKSGGKDYSFSVGGQIRQAGAIISGNFRLGKSLGKNVKGGTSNSAEQRNFAVSERGPLPKFL